MVLKIELSDLNMLGGCLATELHPWLSCEKLYFNPAMTYCMTMVHISTESIWEIKSSSQ
jgi:hypothetical protein